MPRTRLRWGWRLKRSIVETDYAATGEVVGWTREERFWPMGRTRTFPPSVNDDDRARLAVGQGIIATGDEPMPRPRPSRARKGGRGR